MDVPNEPIEQVEIVPRGDLRVDGRRDAIVERHYRLLRTATALTWAGIVLTMCAAVAQRV